MVLRNVELGRSRTQYQLPLSSYTYKYKYIYIYIRDPAPFPSGSWLGFASSPGCPEQPTPQSIRKKKELAIKLAASPEHQIINIAESEWEEEDGGTCACIPASPPVMRWIKMMMEPCRERVREMGNDVSRRQKPSVYIYIFFFAGSGRVRQPLRLLNRVRPIRCGCPEWARSRWPWRAQRNRKRLHLSDPIWTDGYCPWSCGGRRRMGRATRSYLCWRWWPSLSCYCWPAGGNCCETDA